MASQVVFTDAHRQAVDQALRDVYDAKELMRKFSATGMDLSQHQTTADQLEEFLTAFKEAAFTPPGHTRGKHSKATPPGT